MSRLGKMLCAVVAAALGTTGPGVRPALAQIRLPDGRIVQQQTRVQPLSDRIASRGIRRAEEAIAAGQFSQAIQYLDGVLASGEDKFVDAGADGGYAGLKERARQLIRDLPPEGRQAYEAAFSAAAARMLEQAVAAGDSGALQAVARRYFYTPAGYDAAFLLAMDEADAGRHVSAALNYQQLLESPEALARLDPHVSLRAAASWLAAGDEARARDVLDALIARGHRTVQIGGQQRRIDSGAESLSWLRDAVGDLAVSEGGAHQWLTYRGNAARNSESAGGLPHMRVRWKVRLLGHPQLETLFENYVADLTRTASIAPVASHPLAAGDYILTRTPHGLVAVDFRSGKRIWRSEPQTDPQLATLMRHISAAEEEGATQQTAQLFARRMWEDYLFGLISSDGERVYVVQNLPLPVAQDFDMPPWGAPGLLEASQTNRLSAYELATQGKLVWEIDGAVATGELAGAFFLGAPLHVGESLYVLAEIKSGIFLIALDCETGEFQWSQGLADLETGVLLDARRRLQSAMPSYDAGILVCPTGAGVVVGVDLAKRSLAWAYQYETAAGSFINQGRDEDSTGRLARRWQDNAATIVDGRVVLTPPDSDQLHAIDLRSGRPLWKQPRGEMNRIAVADSNRILLIGNRRLQSLRLEDGKPAWKKQSLSLPRGVFPSGAGFVSDSKYYLPLTSAEVISINLTDGRIESRAASRDGAALGNLICHRGAVISQNGMYLDCFDQIDELRRRSEERLAEQPNDVEALRTLGEVAYNEGRLSDAVSLLERAYRADSNDVEVRDVLAECLATALDENFVAHRARLPLLKELNDGAVARRMLILRIEAQGLLEEGEPLASAAACLELYRLAGTPDEMLDLGREHQAAVSRWIQAQLAAIWENADHQQRSELKATLNREAEALGESPSAEDLARFLRFFGNLPMFQQMRADYAKLYIDPLESQQILLDLEHSDDENVRRDSIAEITGQLFAAGLQSLSGEYLSRLKTDSMGRTLLASIGGEKDKANSLREWPRGKVTVAAAPTTGAAANARVRAPLWGVRLERTDSILGLATVYISASRGGELVLHDNFGREFFSANLEPDNQINYRHPGTVYGVSRGNLLILSLGRQIVALNTLASADGLAPPVMWRAGLGGNLQLEYARNFYGEPVPQSQVDRPGSNRAPRPMDEGKWIGVIGPVTSRGVVFQDQRRLVCVDALSGDLRWARSDVEQGCDLFGDDQYVFAVPTDSTTARVYNAIDGRFIGKRAVPEWRQQLVTRGREILCWQVTDDSAELSAFDAFTGDVSWRHEFQPGSAVDVESGRYVAVVESGGRVAVIDGANGEKLVDYTAAAKPTIDEVHLAVGRDDFLVTVKRSRAGNAERQVRPLAHIDDSPVIDGELYLFDRTSGEMRWNRPAEVVQQALLLMQPVDLPFIAFAGQLAHHDGGSSRAMTTMLILDKATGRTLFQSDELPQTGGGHCLSRVTDAANHQAAVEMAGQTILLQFTDERRPPEPPAMAEVESSAGKSSQGLMGIFRNLGVGR